MTLKVFQTLLAIKGINCGDEEASLLESYMFYILDKNEKVNLTAITDKDEFMSKMLFDSALPLLLTNFNDKKVLDIGTGAGFPGAVINLLSTADVSLLDSTAKKLKVIGGFKNNFFHTINARAEDYALEHRKEYDIVIARAVSSLPILLELAMPLLKVGGYFIAMKGPEAEREIKKSENALKKLNCSIQKVDMHVLPTGDERFNILIKKDKETPKQYPRNYAEIKKNPL